MDGDHEDTSSTHHEDEKSALQLHTALTSPSERRPGAKSTTRSKQVSRGADRVVKSRASKPGPKFGARAPTPCESCKERREECRLSPKPDVTSCQLCSRRRRWCSLSDNAPRRTAKPVPILPRPPAQPQNQDPSGDWSSGSPIAGEDMLSLAGTMRSDMNINADQRFYEDSSFGHPQPGSSNQAGLDGHAQGGVAGHSVDRFLMDGNPGYGFECAAEDAGTLLSTLSAMSAPAVTPTLSDPSPYYRTEAIPNLPPPPTPSHGSDLDAQLGETALPEGAFQGRYATDSGSNAARYTYTQDHSSSWRFQE